MNSSWSTQYFLQKIPDAIRFLNESAPQKAVFPETQRVLESTVRMPIFQSMPYQKGSPEQNDGPTLEYLQIVLL